MPPAEPATSSNSLSTGPGQTCVTTTPVPVRSALLGDNYPDRSATTILAASERSWSVGRPAFG